MTHSLRITEIFYSLQGESNTVGLPTVFIRLTGCPLRCVYCDTAYAFTGGKKIPLTEIIAEVAQYGCKYVTVTGGEPLAQPACLELMTQLLDKGHIVSLETSGALDVSAVDPRVIKVMDIKTPSSGEVDKNLYANIDHLTAHDQIKFVIGNDKDYHWSKATLTEYDLLNRCEILFSPVMGQQNPTELAEKILSDRLPVRFQIQLHKLLWNDAQGK
ncbi:MAG: 7-carboxy-7-deazaguanine synthase QueE [Methylococcaceae bacterium]|nr:7-carboxy-7-deazaguanine synthase QueE [Methylococcaceae bacterium]MDD1607782.1 7-carboxy-7-deazaguanine synthase QueE [Methylococcaceae bacterium]MDD1610864.1 7-carboxy-7-deazaguanine synthase QueE [Methylococcaceae bacterium]MDD1616852.1 7-carboxy-7-deazaguanine synthase QueE [Methylococcaceae bacterium]OYV16671.1 MAG: queuosine biosynthesis protein QueE [Methylococcaceae bacterium NSP1-2]